MRFSLALVMALALGTGCATKRSDPVGDYIAADAAVRGTVLSSGNEAKAIARFRGFFADVTEDSVRAKTAKVYAPDAFFNDTLKTLRGAPAIEEYFLKVASHSDYVRATVVDVSRSGDNYYLRWVMDTRFRGSNKTIRTIGMTHVRFNREGLVVLHQDFWDSTAGFFEHVPVLGPAIRGIKSLL